MRWANSIAGSAKTEIVGKSKFFEFGTGENMAGLIVQTGWFWARVCDALFGSGRQCQRPAKNSSVIQI
jgi:hypothetical protein